MTDEFYPPVGFYFAVGFNSPNSDLDGKFQEVSGIYNEMGDEPVADGGEFKFKHRTPTIAKYSNLVLKKGILALKSDLAKWVTETLTSGLKEPVKPKNIYVSLLGSGGNVSIQWVFIDAWPVKWELSSLDSMKNEILAESIEFSYSSCKVNHFT